MQVTNADSSIDEISLENQEQCCMPCCKNYQIKASRFDNEFIIDGDDGVSVGQVKIYAQSDRTSAFIMNMKKDAILAIHVRVSLPNTAFFYTPTTGGDYTYAGQLSLEMSADSKRFLFQNGTPDENSPPSITIECSASSRKFHLYQEGEQCGSFSFDYNNIVVSNDQSQFPCDPQIMLGIAFSASFFLPFKG